MRGSAALIIGLIHIVSIIMLPIDDLFTCHAPELCQENFFNEFYSSYFVSMDEFRITFDRDEFLRKSGWSLISPEHQCILTPGTEESMTVSLVCSSLYSKETIVKTLQMINTKLMIYLNCHRNDMSMPDQDVSQIHCYCYDVEIPTKLSLELESFSDSITVISSFRCNNNTLTMTNDNFKGQEYVLVIVLEHTPFAAVSAHAFDDLATLMVVSFVNNLFTTRDLPTGLFCNNSKLMILQLEGENFQQFPSQLFECSSVPCLPQLDTVVIRNTGIKTLPQELFGCAQNITWLDLSHNKITNISNLKMQQLDELLFLILSHNIIHQLEPFVFANFSKLLQLDLSHNQLTYMDNSWFLGLPSLYKLYLDNNKISALEGSIHMLPIDGLSLHHNCLEILPVNVLNGSKTLEYLELQGNHLTDLRNGSMNDLVSIFSLNLSMNKISNLDSLIQAFEEPAPSLFWLFLGHNEITEINQHALSLFPGLETLVLKNNLIQCIHPQAFAVAQNLTFLALDGNRISQLTPNLFVNLSRLVYLNLASNSISSLDNDVFTGLTSLMILSLSGNNIKAIASAIFHDLQGIILILLTGNLIKEIENNVFPPHLETLFIANNQLSSLPCLEYGNKLSRIQMGSNNVSVLQIPANCNFENLEALWLEDNIIDSIAAGTFKRATSLERLVLSNNKLDLNFSVNYFEGIRLIDIYLNHNRITSLDNLFSQDPLTFIKGLHLKGNPITHIPEPVIKNAPLVNAVDLAECNITYLDQDSFAHMHRLRQINLTGNLIRVFPKLRLSSTVSIELFKNPIECSCRMKWIKEVETTAIYNFNFCINPVNQSSVALCTFPLSHFVCPTDIVCDRKLCKCFSQDLNGSPGIVNCSQKHSSTLPRKLASTAELLYLHGNDYAEIKMLSAFPEKNFQAKVLTLNNCNTKKLETKTFQNFKFLEELYLHDNNLTVLPAGLFTPLKLLRILTLHNNHLFYLESEFLSPNKLIVELRLNNNYLSKLSEDTHLVLANLPYLQTLTLSGNPWECKCDNMSWKSWLLDMEDKLDNHYDILCANGTAVLATPDENFLCTNDTYMYAPPDVHAFALTTGLAVVLPVAVIIVMAAGFYHRHMLAVFVFSVFGMRLRKKQEAEGCEYDVMLIYNYRNIDPNLDLDNAVWWVYEQMNPEFKVLHSERDIDPGSDWPTEICKGIYSSKKTVMVLSVALLEQIETMFIFDKCYHMNMERHSLDLIIILDSKQTAKYIKGSHVSDLRLKAYLQTNHCLILGERSFYQRLLYLLPEPDVVDNENTVDRRQDKTLL